MYASSPFGAAANYMRQANSSINNISNRMAAKEKVASDNKRYEDQLAYRNKVLNLPEQLRQKHQQETQDILLGADSRAQQYGNAINDALTKSDANTGPKIDDAALGDAIMKSGQLDALTNGNDLQAWKYKQDAAINSGNKDAIDIATKGYNAAINDQSAKNSLYQNMKKAELDNVDFITNKKASMLGKLVEKPKTIKESTYKATGKGIGKKIKYTGQLSEDYTNLTSKWQGIVSKTSDWSGSGFNDISDKIQEYKKKGWSPEQIDQAFQYSLQNDNGSWVTPADGLNIMNGRLKKFTEANVNSKDPKVQAMWKSINTNNYMNNNGGYSATSKSNIKHISGNGGIQELKLSRLLESRNKARKAIEKKYAAKQTPKQKAYEELMSILNGSGAKTDNSTHAPGSDTAGDKVNGNPSEPGYKLPTPEEINAKYKKENTAYAKEQKLIDEANKRNKSESEANKKLIRDKKKYDNMSFEEMLNASKQEDSLALDKILFGGELGNYINSDKYKKGLKNKKKAKGLKAAEKSKKHDMPTKEEISLQKQRSGALNRFMQR